MNIQERKKFYKSKTWQNIRLLVLQRDNYECVMCKREGKVTLKAHKPDKHKVLDVDHIKSLEHYPHLGYQMDNLQTLCVRCHNKKENRFHSFQRKPNKWEDDEMW